MNKNIYMTLETADRLMRLMKSTGLSASSIISKAIELYAKKTEQPERQGRA